MLRKTSWPPEPNICRAEPQQEHQRAAINAMITLLGQILQQAVDYELIDRNPVRVGGRSARFLKRTRPKRTFLEVDEFHALLDAAGELEAEARTDFKGL